MQPEKYKELRKYVGTQKEVAAQLGISRCHISNRENGKKPISKEAELAMSMLHDWALMNKCFSDL